MYIRVAGYRNPWQPLYQYNKDGLFEYMLSMHNTYIIYSWWNDLFSPLDNDFTSGHGHTRMCREGNGTLGGKLVVPDEHRYNGFDFLDCEPATTTLIQQ